MNYDKEYIPCPVHGYRVKDMRGCWRCLEDLRLIGKLEEKKEASYAKRINQIPIKKQSDKKKAREKELAKLRKAKKLEQRWCEGCGVSFGFSDYSHILSVKQFQKYELHPENAVIHCRGCHLIWQDGSLEEKMKLGNWQQMLNFILKYEPAYFNKLQLKSLNKAA